MRERLIFAESEDGLPLEGVVMEPEEPKLLPVVWVHGLTGRFSNRTEVWVGRALAGRGHPFLAGNNRGHDFGGVYWRDGQARLGGGAWELFEESPHDVDGWINCAASMGHEKVILAGHSLGALKVCYYQALRQDPRVVGLVAASPPGRPSWPTPELLAQAEAMVAEGRGRELLPWGSHPTGITLSADAYVNRGKVGMDVYGIEAAAASVTRVKVPVLAFYGDHEAHIGGPAELAAIERNAATATTRMIFGADHSYAGHEQEVAGVISEWAEGLVS